MVDRLISNACDALLNYKSDDGSFEVDMEFDKVPPFFRHKIVRTSEAIRTLIYSGNKSYLPYIFQSLFYCLNTKLSKNDELNFLCSKLKAIRFLENDYARQNQSKIINLLLERQDEKGYWGVFPDTYNLLNFSAVDPLYMYEREPVQSALSKLGVWFYEHMALDKKGWGFNHKSKLSENSYTANVLLSLIRIRDLRWKTIDKVLINLKKNQRNDGGFSSSSTTIDDRSTVYSTALLLVSFLILSKDPFNSVTLRAVEYLKSSALPTGGWGLLDTDSELQIYTTYYAVYALKLFEYFESNYSASRYEFIPKNRDFNLFLFDEFERGINEQFSNGLIDYILNSKIYGTSREATARRKAIIKIFSMNGILEVGDVIDKLKLMSEYKSITKRYHITMVKSDLEFLKNIGILVKQKNKFCLIGNFVK